MSESRRINIMPPIASWRGDVKPDEHGPHPTHWVLYVNGDEVACAVSHGEIMAALERFLLGARD